MPTRNLLFSYFYITCRAQALNAIPLELKGRIDPSKSHKVKFLFNGQEKEMEVSEGTSLLDAAGKKKTLLICTLNWILESISN